jgi:hypothetical protein
MKTLLLILTTFFSANSLLAQYGDTIFQSLITNAPSTAGATVAIRNIGQTLHQIVISSTDAPSLDCDTASGLYSMLIEGSYDNTNWTTVAGLVRPVNTQDAIGNLSLTMTGYGSYPFLRYRKLAIGDAKCLISAAYSGNIQGNIAPFQPERLTTVYGSVTFSLGGNFIVDVDMPFRRGFCLQYLSINNAVAGQTLTWFADSARSFTIAKYVGLAAGQTIIWPMTGECYQNLSESTTPFTIETNR